MNISLSFITPCFNSEKFISVAIESFVNQGNASIELIIVDDGSTDNTEEICSKYTNEFSNIKYIKVDNGGAGKARNIGIKNAEGKMIAFLDSDDALVVNSFSIEIVNELMNMIDSGVDIIYTSRLVTDMQLTAPIQITFPESINEIKHNIPALEFWTCIYSKEFLNKNNIRFYEYKEQDIETAFRYKAFSTAKKIKVCQDIKFYLQRDNLDSNTHTWNKYNLYKIKATVYFDLFQTTKIDEDKVFLKKEVLTYIYLFYKICVLYGSRNKNDIEVIHQIYKKIHNTKKFKEKRCDELIKKISILDSFRYIILLRRCKTQLNTKKIENYDNEEIIKRLRKISADIMDVQ